MQFSRPYTLFKPNSYPQCAVQAANNMASSVQERTFFVEGHLKTESFKTSQVIRATVFAAQMWKFVEQFGQAVYANTETLPPVGCRYEDPYSRS
jgi:hypothetical protein